MADAKSTRKRRPPEDRIGETFYQLTVVAIVKSPKGVKLALCKCECGRDHRCCIGDLEHGKTRRCRECQRKGSYNGRFRHGGKGTPEYEIWMAMHARCRRPESNPRGDYLGISVCERWSGRDGFANFLADMGMRPSPDHSIDRYPNQSGNYEPTNCRWATGTQQQRNKRNNHLLTYNGRTATLAEWSEATGLNLHTMLGRLSRGWSTEKTLTTPPLPSRWD